MKLTITTALTAAVLATSAAADARYEAVTPMGADTPVLNIPESNERFQAVAQPQSPELASQSNADAFENPVSEQMDDESEYQDMKDRLQNIYR